MLLMHALNLFQMELEKVKFFAKPKLGLDCVGGASALRLSDALAQVSLLMTLQRVHQPRNSLTAYMSQPATINQSINQSINQLYQSVSQSINQSVSQSVSQSINQPTNPATS